MSKQETENYILSMRQQGFSIAGNDGTALKFVCPICNGLYPNGNCYCYNGTGEIKR